MTDDYDVIALRVIFPVGDDFSPVDEDDEDLEFPVVAVTINGIDLRTRVEEALRRQRPGVEFCFESDWICLGLHEVAAPSKHWLGLPRDPELVVGGRLAVLTCNCGAFGCGGTAARIEVTDDTVTWSDFVDSFGHREAVGTFRFDRAQYEREIEKLA
jgi:hypothetical protein